MGNQFTRIRSKKKQSIEKSIQPSHTGTLDEQSMKDQAMAMAKHELYIASLSARSKMLQETIMEPSRHSYSGRASYGRLDFSRSYSSQDRRDIDSLLDPVPSMHLRRVQEKYIGVNLESRHFVLVHGGGLGAWCWYKSIALLEDSGLRATAVDLMGSGIEPTDPNRITSLMQYSKPLLEALKSIESTPGHEKVILVGHSVGGACISYAMECFPNLISKAIFIAATMVSNNQSAFDVLAKHIQSPDALMTKAQIFIYGNGRRKPPTALTFDKSLTGDLFFAISPAKDVVLATHSMRPMPFAPAMEKLCLTHSNYGKVRRFYISTTADQALPFPAQHAVVEENPPERVFTVRGSDHCPFFSKPQSLHRIFLEIAQMNGKH
ncbi:putative methylesterase 12, chloroplastic [Physcomitrium patens]|uniref:AB hydrolase-1 domain-containing protein n=1 Tax=Physcomitrium patens TaxID=3218 RepID=A0A2K1IGW0_PHYPA|nr:putative methylesterase 12, chloroplastic [Physcomitrium patens]PNR28517.1 hypothetical protein PHYPA_029109 [Physcomitrium patens]|eukprot:XP_024364209.1 putative methylesterase 12, chloroplastic [Physcomitrella patens]